MSATNKTYWNIWVRDLRFTWLAALSISVLPAILYGATIFSLMLFLATALFGFPTVLAALLLTKEIKWRSRLLRRVGVLAAVPALMILMTIQTDQMSPKLATPIAKAIESFKQDSGAYPDSLAILIPDYLSNLPIVRISVFQPEVIYRVKDGRPYLAIPSSAGDAFSAYEYSFDKSEWKHY